LKSAKAEWAEKLRASGFVDLESSTGLLSNRCNKISDGNVSHESEESYLEFARQLLEDPETRWPTRWHKAYWEFHAFKFGRVEIKKRMGECNWRRLARAVAWGNLQMNPCRRHELNKAASLLRRHLTWPRGYKSLWKLHSQGMSFSDIQNVKGRTWVHLPLYDAAVAWGTAKQEALCIKGDADKTLRQRVRDLSTDELRALAKLFSKESENE